MSDIGRLKWAIERLQHEDTEADNRAKQAHDALKVAKDELAVLICPVQVGDIIYHKDVRREGRVIDGLYRKRKVPVLKRLEVGEICNSGFSSRGGYGVKGWNIRKDGTRGQYILAYSFDKWVRESDGLIVFEGGL